MIWSWNAMCQKFILYVLCILYFFVTSQQQHRLWDAFFGKPRLYMPAFCVSLTETPLWAWVAWILFNATNNDIPNALCQGVISLFISYIETCFFVHHSHVFLCIHSFDSIWVGIHSNWWAKNSSYNNIIYAWYW